MSNDNKKPYDRFVSDAEDFVLEGDPRFPEVMERIAAEQVEVERLGQEWRRTHPEFFKKGRM